MEMHAARSESGIHAVGISGCDWLLWIGGMVCLIRRDFGGMFGQELLAESLKVSSLLLLKEEFLESLPSRENCALCRSGELPFRIEADSNGCWVGGIYAPSSGGCCRTSQKLGRELRHKPLASSSLGGISRRQERVLG